ncbi:MAG TPA: VWA domain-containing protein [Bacteroidota bacterium]|nr:VWA domain-containing protein [Bacteroidota bacterium]
MIRFAHPEYLYWLALVPLTWALFWFVGRKQREAREKFSTSGMFERLASESSGAKRVTKSILVLGAVACIVVGLANPQVGIRQEEVKQEGVDIFIALDVSLSMKAEDVKPNRLAKAKYEINNLIGRLAGDRIGLIIFSGESYVQFPLTTDYSAADLFLDAVDVESVPTPGTAIGSAVEKAMKSFDLNTPTKKVLVIITDGEDNEGDAIGPAEDAGKKGVLIYTIGMGSPAGAPIPIYDAGGKQVDFKRDRAGNVVLTKLDETTLEKMATLGNGKYFRATNSQDELDVIYKEVNALQKSEFGTKQFTDFEDQFQYFIGLALLLLVIDVFLSDKKIPWLDRINPFKAIAVDNDESIV